MKKKLMYAMIAVNLTMAINVFAVLQDKNLLPGSAEFKNDDVHIIVNVQSSVYTYKVTNPGDSPIVKFEINQHAAYNFITPKGWEKEEASDIFRAWTDDPKNAIEGKKAAEFSMRVSSSGAVLGLGTVKVYFQSGKISTLGNLWVPASEPKSYIILVAVLILAVMLFHTAIIVYKNRRGGKLTV